MPDTYREILNKLEYAILLCVSLDTHQSHESRELMLADLIANLSDSLAEAQVKLALMGEENE